MSKPRKDEMLKMPRFRGGESALRDFLKQNLKYPKEALDNKIEGAVEASYDVDGNGVVRNIKITESLGHGCDEEVIRLIKLLKYEKAFNKGRRVTSHKKLKVDFRLPTQPKSKKINYTVTKPNTTKTEQKPTKSTYSYTIKLGK